MVSVGNLKAKRLENREQTLSLEITEEVSRAGYYVGQLSPHYCERTNLAECFWHVWQYDNSFNNLFYLLIRPKPRLLYRISRPNSQIWQSNSFLTSFKFAKFCRAVKITIQIHSLIIRFNFYVKGICIYVIQFKKCLTSIQIRDRTSRRLNWMTRLRK